MSARGFFYAILPLLEAGKPYGNIDMNAIELAEFFDVSVHHTRRYIADLKKFGILRESPLGGLFCPMLIRLRMGVPR
jgi:DNA-binding IclR family transcriptional regulator